MLKLVVATSLLVLVAGCTDPEPKEPKPTTSATPTATAPTMPEQAKENTPEGASAFVAHARSRGLAAPLGAGFPERRVPGPGQVAP